MTSNELQIGPLKLEGFRVPTEDRVTVILHCASGAQEVTLTGEEWHALAPHHSPPVDIVNLIADPKRAQANGLTRIYVRAWVGRIDGPIKTADVAELDLPSLRAWMRSRGGANPWAEQAFALSCGHEPDEVQAAFGKELLRL